MAREFRRVIRLESFQQTQLRRRSIPDNANQLALAKLRAVKADLSNQAEADRLENSIVKWIKYLTGRMKTDFDYEMP